jgi:DNA-binding MltR family transcriptional regulator
MRARSSVRKVLECQKLLGELNIDATLKSEMLAAVSKSHTGPEQLIAEVFGKADEAAAIMQQFYSISLSPEMKTL